MQLKNSKKNLLKACLQLSLTELTRPSYVLVPSNNNLLMYNIFDGTLRQTFKGHFETVNCAHYNPVLNEIYTGAKDRNVLIWSAERPDTSDANTSRQQRVNGATTSAAAAHTFTSNNNPFLNTNTNDNNKRSRDNWSDDDDD